MAMTAGPSMPPKKHLLVLLDECATSFCHYTNPRADSTHSQLMPLKILKQVMKYSKTKGYSPQFILGGSPLPDEYESELVRIAHARIVPISHPKTYANSITVINPGNYGGQQVLNLLPKELLVLRISRADIPKLAEIAIPLLDKCKRLNLCLLDIEHYAEKDIVLYRAQLDLISKNLAERHKTKCSVEVSCLTDRLILRQMSNCEAGANHFTVAPDGRLYVCPAFYYCGDSSIGDVSGRQIFPNSHLLNIKHAPVCSMCDAFHCKRCVFLNKKLTLEVNTPSWQQCKIAHCERESSRFLLSMIDWPIPTIDYDDPLSLATRVNQ